jgi:hypothetical protein
MNLRSALVGAGATLALMLLTAAGCDETKPTNTADKANQTAQSRTNYVPANDVEGHNYNARLKIADSPATLIWCSAYPTNPNVKPFTVPIAGKLTSGNKRPFQSQNAKSNSNGNIFYEEQADAQGMYGTSGEYRYGFDPAGNYHDFYGLEVYCTTVPTVIQKNTTEIAIGVSGDLNAIDKQVEAALAACRKVNTDPSVACPQAAALLGVK